MHAASADNMRHFLGTIVTKYEGQSKQGVPTWGIIDGQQRLTTISILLIAMRDYMTETRKRLKTLSADELHGEYLVNPHKTGEDMYRLVLRRNDKDALCALVNCDLSQVPAEYACVKANYDWFRSKIADADLGKLWSGIDRLLIAAVEVESSDDAQAIYESLNNTGINLSKSDLIRNRILMGLPADEQARLYGRYWTEIEDLFLGEKKEVFVDFVGCYLDMKRQRRDRTDRGLIYDPAFREFWREIEKGGAGAIEPALQDILDHARRYAEFRYGRLEKSRSRKKLSKGRESRYAPIRHSKPVAITVMRLLECRDREDCEFSEDRFLDALRVIESYLMRRDVCQRPGSSYRRVFAELASGIGASDPLMDLKVVFRMIPRKHAGYEFPSDTDFRAKLIGEDLYREDGENKACKRFLDGILNYETKEPDPHTHTYSIEHIMPQGNPRDEWKEMLGDEWKEIQEEWKHRLGNLTLTGYNQEYSNRSFAEKKKIENGFNDSAIRLNKYVREQEEWTRREMEERTGDLAERSLKIWKALEVDASEVLRWRKEREKAKSRVKMSEQVSAVFDDLHRRILDLGEDINTFNEAMTVSYHRRRFFLEILPQRTKLMLLLALDFDSAEDPSGKKKDPRERRSITGSQYKIEVRTIYSIPILAGRAPKDEMVKAAIHLIEQAYRAAE